MIALQARLAPSLAGAEAEWVRSAELRYGGQTWEVEVELDGGRVDTVVLAALVDRFEDEHERLYGVRGEAGSPIEIRALRVAGLGPSSAVDRLVPAAGRAPGGRRPQRGGRRRARPRSPSAAANRSASSPEPGPLLVDEYDTTVIVRRGWTARRDPATSTLILERR